MVPFSSPDDVAAYFGALSDEYARAQLYFQGFKNATRTPGQLLFSRFSPAPSAACYVAVRLRARLLNSYKNFPAR
ncbi:DUF3383 family protein [Escherichia coli]